MGNGRKLTKEEFI